MTIEQICTNAAERIAAEYTMLHRVGPSGQLSKKWNKLFGQYLVYGFERSIGFGEAVALCATLEQAHKGGKDIKVEAYKFFKDLVMKALNNQGE